MLSAGAHIPLMQDVTTSTLIIGMSLGISVALWIISKRPEWMAVAASTFILVYMVGGR